MAALQKIRSKGILLISIVFLGLFAFIAEDLFRSIETTANHNRQQVGVINGKKISVQEFQNTLNKYEEFLKFTQSKNTLNEDETNRAKDAVWQTLISYELVAHECEKLGLTVTDNELQDVLTEGTNPMLAQTPFVDQNTGRFDVNALKNFLQEYQKMTSGAGEEAAAYQQYGEYYDKINNVWNFTESTLRKNLLLQKYQVLVAKGLISNPVEAKMIQDAAVATGEVLLAAYPYSAVADKDIEIGDADLKAKYNELKEAFMQPDESRDIKYIAVKVEASGSDKADLMIEMEEILNKVNESTNLAATVRGANSLINYTGIPVTKDALPSDIQAELDSMAPGTTKGPYYNPLDNTDNIIRYVAKVMEPDSVKYRLISVGGVDAADAEKRADSIYTALKGGADFAEIAKIYGQEGKENWLSSAQYQTSLLDEDNTKFIKLLNTAPKGLHNDTFGQGHLIIDILDRTANIAKYDVAVIKRPVTYSKETYTKAYNKLSHFISGKTLKEIEENASKEGYVVETRPNLLCNEHNVANCSNTRETMKWIYDSKTKIGDISPLYECGQDGSILVVALTKINKKGYRPFEDVKDDLRMLVINDKKAEVIKGKLADVKNIDAATAIAGVKADSTKLSAMSPAFIAMTGSMEPNLSGSFWNAKEGDFVGPVKGMGGVYCYQVLNIEKAEQTPELKDVQANVAQQLMRNAMRYGNDLYISAKVSDKRYLFF